MFQRWSVAKACKSRTINLDLVILVVCQNFDNGIITLPFVKVVLAPSILDGDIGVGWEGFCVSLLCIIFLFLMLGNCPLCVGANRSGGRALVAHLVVENNLCWSEANALNKSVTVLEKGT